MAKIMTWRMWVAIAFLAMAIIAIKPTFNAEGITIKTVASDSILAEQGLTAGQKLVSINDQQIQTLDDFNNALKALKADEQTVTVATTEKTHKYNITDSIGFITDQNLTVTESETFSPLERGEKILAINSKPIADATQLSEELNKILPTKKIIVVTEKGKFAYLGTGAPKITAAQASPTNLKKGLDLEGGTRVLLKPVKETGEVTDQEIADMISVLDNRLNVYGLSDLKIRPSKDWQNNKYILIEIAGISKDEVIELI